MAQEKKQYLIPFATRLRYYVEKWQKEEGKTQDDLAEAVGLSDRKSISNYLNAYQKPSKEKLLNLCDVLGTTPDELNGLNDDFITKYQYDSKTASSVRNGYEAFCTGIGLSNDFLKYVRSALPDESFPLFTRIVADPLTDHFYREDSKITAETNIGSEYQIYTAAGEHTDLSYPDYAFLKDVQDQVTELVEYLYFKRQKQLDAALKTVNDECIVTSQTGLTIVKEPSEKLLCDTDPYYRFILGEQGKIIKAETEKRKQ